MAPGETGVSIAGWRAVEVDGWLASVGRSSDHRVGMHGRQAPVVGGLLVALDGFRLVVADDSCVDHSQLHPTVLDVCLLAVPRVEQL